MAATAPPVAQSARRPTNFPYILCNDFLGEDLGAFGVGGLVGIFTAAAALNVGDGVYLSAAFTVNKSAVAGNQTLCLGVVVGGSPRSVQDGTVEALGFTEIGDPACLAAGERVLVGLRGIFYAVADAAIAAAGSQLKLSTTVSGRVAPATIATDAGKIIGKNIDIAAGAGNFIRILVDLG
jgi:hypothetical protein